MTLMVPPYLICNRYHMFPCHMYDMIFFQDSFQRGPPCVLIIRNCSSNKYKKTVTDQFDLRLENKERSSWPWHFFQLNPSCGVILSQQLGNNTDTVVSSNVGDVMPILYPKCTSKLDKKLLIHGLFCFSHCWWWHHGGNLQWCHNTQYGTSTDGDVTPIVYMLVIKNK